MKNRQNNERLIGPFTQIVTMGGLVPYGPLSDKDLKIISNGAIAVDANGFITAVDTFTSLQKKHLAIEEIPHPAVAFPGLIDAHTHLCYSGNRAEEYALRLQGISYLEIARQGGGILATVKATRASSKELLIAELLLRLNEQLRQGITTCEIKSGYGLSVKEELKQLEAIKAAAEQHPVSIISTCLAAHISPPKISAEEYLQMLYKELLPEITEKKLATRIDIFIEKGAFSVNQARPYLKEAKRLGFSLCIHANQFSNGGVELAAEMGARSADHLEQISNREISLLRAAAVIPIVLPGSSLGLGVSFAPARRLLDGDLPLVIASDRNPGSAPMGLLLLQAAILAAAEKLTMAETWAALTCRAAAALALADRGILASGLRADLLAFPCADWREVLYRQGALLPNRIWVKGCPQFF